MTNAMACTLFRNVTKIWIMITKASCMYNKCSSNKMS